MMDCAAYKQAILGDPGHPSADMLAHVATCHDCTGYTQQVLHFEGRIDRALRIVTDEAGAGTIPATRSERPVTARSRRLRRSLAIAASVLVAVVVAGGLWLGATGPSLAADVVSHMADEPDAWVRTTTPVPQPELNAVMKASNMRLKSGAGLVSYANSCSFRGHQVPHLVLQTADGPVTVMVLTHEQPRGAVRFDEHGYHGIIIPVPDRGSLAVLEHGPPNDDKAMDGVAASVLAAIEWTP